VTNWEATSRPHMKEKGARQEPRQMDCQGGRAEAMRVGVGRGEMVKKGERDRGGEGRGTG
jgi:hypothetical protein